MKKVIRELVQAGADPHAEDVDTASPISLLLRDEDAWSRHADLLEAMGARVHEPSGQEDEVSGSVNPLNPAKIDRALPVADTD